MIDTLCGTCRFWDPYNDTSGNCQRYAPKPILWHSLQGNSAGNLTDALWPVTSEADYCGEWEASK